jgi:formyltetrahydrofolate deformylase
MDLIATLSCPDQPGIVHAVTSAILECDGNIIENQQFTDVPSGTFLMRTRFETARGVDETREEFEKKLTSFNPSITIRERSKKKRGLILVSRESHCIRDLIYLHEINELPIEIPLVISNHQDLAPLIKNQGIEFQYVEVDPQNKDKAEAELESIIRNLEIDFIVLARYMQILSEEFSLRYAGKIINIHHSFLPSFKGAKPYHQAFERGVKIIGATAHFVTPVLDEGPIIDQDVAYVGHGANLEQMISLGRDVERRVLARAVRFYAEDRIFIVENRTIVFH